MTQFKVHTSGKTVRVVLVRRAPKGPYYARFWFRGKAHFPSTGKLNEQGAKDWTITEIGRLDGSSGHTAKLLETVTACIVDRWGPDEPLSNTHHYGTNALLKRFAAFCGPETDLARLDFDSAIQAVQKFLDRKRDNKASAQTLTSEQRIISRFFSWLLQNRKVSWRANPASKTFLTLPKVHHTPRPPVTAGELGVLLCEAKRTPAWPAVVLIIASGMRPAGTQRVKVEHVDLENKLVKVFEKGRWRHVPLNTWAHSELKEWIEARPGKEFLVQCTRNTLYDSVKNIRRRNNLRPEVTLQGCRRTFIKMCLDLEMSAQLVAGIAGNSVAVIERHYVDMSTLKAHAALEGLNLGSLVEKTKNKTKTDKAT